MLLIGVQSTRAGSYEVSIATKDELIALAPFILNGKSLRILAHVIGGKLYAEDVQEGIEVGIGRQMMRRENIATQQALIWNALLWCGFSEPKKYASFVSDYLGMAIGKLDPEPIKNFGGTK